MREDDPWAELGLNGCSNLVGTGWVVMGQSELLSATSLKKPDALLPSRVAPALEGTEVLVVVAGIPDHEAGTFREPHHSGIGVRAMFVVAEVDHLRIRPFHTHSIAEGSAWVIQLAGGDGPRADLAGLRAQGEKLHARRNERERNGKPHPPVDGIDACDQVCFGATVRAGQSQCALALLSQEVWQAQHVIQVEVGEQDDVVSRGGLGVHETRAGINEESTTWNLKTHTAGVTTEAGVRRGKKRIRRAGAPERNLHEHT